MKELWVEKYRPSTIEGYVFRDSHQREQVKAWIKEKSIPHLLFSGSAGIGKTTLAKILFNELEVNDLDLLEKVIYFGQVKPMVLYLEEFIN